MHFDLVEEFINGPGDNSSEILISRKILEKGILSFSVQIFRYHSLPITTKHCIGFARARLPVGENSHIKAFGNFTNGRHKLIEHFSLRTLLTKSIVKFGL